MGGLTKSLKKVTDVARAGANPGGSLIRAARGQPVVGHNSFASVADPLNAVHAASAVQPNTGPSGAMGQGFSPPISGPFIDPRTNMAPGAGQPMGSMNQFMGGGSSPGQLPITAGGGGKNQVSVPPNQMQPNPQTPPVQPGQTPQRWGIGNTVPGQFQR
jgi:hypothetical protein